MKYRRLLDDDPRKEWERQDKMLLQLEQRFQPMFEKEILRESRRLAAFYAETGEVGPISPYHRERLLEISLDLARVATQAFGGRIVDQAKSNGLILETKASFFDAFMRIADEYINDEMFRRRITQVSETTRGHIVRTVQTGYEKGETLAQVSQRISDSIGSIAKWRADVISRTETHGAAVSGADGAARETGLNLMKEWISVNDERTRAMWKGARFDHESMNGEVIGMDEAFEVPDSEDGYELLKFPGDPAGSAGNIINCRCLLGYVMAEDEYFGEPSTPEQREDLMEISDGEIVIANAFWKNNIKFVDLVQEIDHNNLPPVEDRGLEYAFLQLAQEVMPVYSGAAYRGIYGHFDVVEGQTVETDFIESFSTSKTVAESFTKPPTKWMEPAVPGSTPILFVINDGKFANVERYYKGVINGALGQQVANLDDVVTDFGHEQEVLSLPGSKYKITSVVESPVTDAMRNAGIEEDFYREIHMELIR